MNVSDVSVPAPVNRRGAHLLLGSALLSAVGSVVLFIVGSDFDLALLVVTAVLAPAGFALRNRHERLVWGENQVFIKPGMFSQAIGYPLWSRSKVVLGWKASGHNKEAAWFLGIDVAGDGHLETVKALDGLHHGELRMIAEALCKHAKVPLVDNTDQQASQTFAPEDLDLPLGERLRRYPRLRLTRQAIPHNSGFHDIMQQDGSRLITYRPRWVTPVACLSGVTLLGLLGAVAVYKVTDLGTMDVVLAGGLLAIVLVVLGLHFGVRGEVGLKAGDVSHCVRLGPVALSSRHLAASEIEEVRDLPFAVEVVSDRLIVTIPFDYQSLVHYVAYEIQHTLEHQASLQRAAAEASTSSAPSV